MVWKMHQKQSQRSKIQNFLGGPQTPLVRAVPSPPKNFFKYYFAPIPPPPLANFSKWNADKDIVLAPTHSMVEMGKIYGCYK